MRAKRIPVAPPPDVSQLPNIRLTGAVLCYVALSGP
jgi:hypothetical protein